MKKFILTLSICLLCLFAWNLSEASAITIEVDGVKLQSDTSPEIVNGRTFVPLRVIFEALNAEVKWDDTSKTVYANKEGTKLDIKIGDKKALLNGQKVDMDESAYISNGRTMIPVRFIGENLNYTVNWNNASREVVLTSNDYNQNNEVVGEGITVIVDGKVSDLSNDAKLVMTEYNDEKIVIMPLEKLARQLNKYTQIIYEGENFRLVTNSDIYKGSVGKYKLEPILNLEHRGLSDYSELIGTEFYMDAKYVAKSLFADYSYNRESKIVTIDTVNSKFENMPYDMKVSSLRELREKATDYTVIATEPKGELKIFFDAPLNEIEGDYSNNTLKEVLYDSQKVSGMYLYFSHNNDGFINVTVEYENEIARDTQLKANKKAKEIASKLTNNNMSDREKTVVLNKYIIENIEYDQDAYDSYSSHPLFTGKALCDGYADSLFMLLHQAGVEADTIYGLSSNGINHKWVLVNIDGKWLHVDPTWNDSNPPNQYLLKTDEEMRKTHKW